MLTVKRYGKMTTMKEYLTWYNNRDVVPFLEALAKQVSFYSQLRVDMFKDGISVPGLTLKYLFKTAIQLFACMIQRTVTCMTCSKATMWVDLTLYFITTTKQVQPNYVNIYMGRQPRLANSRV